MLANRSHFLFVVLALVGFRGTAQGAPTGTVQTCPLLLEREAEGAATVWSLPMFPSGSNIRVEPSHDGQKVVLLSASGEAAKKGEHWSCSFENGDYSLAQLRDGDQAFCRPLFAESSAETVFSPDGSQVVVRKVGNPADFLAFDTLTGQLLGKLDYEPGQVLVGVARNRPAIQRLGRSNVELWTLDRLGAKKFLTGNIRMNSDRYSPSGRYFLTTWMSAYPRSGKQGRAERTLQISDLHSDAQASINFSSIFEMADEVTADSISLHFQNIGQQVQGGPSKFSLGEKYLATSSVKEVVIFDFSAQQELFRRTAKANIQSVQFSKAADRFAYSTSKTVEVIEVPSTSPIATIRAPADLSFGKVALSPNGKVLVATLLAANTQSWLGVWDLETKKQIIRLAQGYGDTEFISFPANEGLIVHVERDGAVFRIVPTSGISDELKVPESVKSKIGFRKPQLFKDGTGGAVVADDGTTFIWKWNITPEYGLK